MFYTTGMLIENKLPTSIEALQKLCLQQQTTIKEQNHALNESSKRIKTKDNYIEQLEERLSLLLSQRYHARSEQLNHLQIQLFDESELEQAIQDARVALDEASSESMSKVQRDLKTAQKASPKRESLPSHLRRVEILIDVSDQDKQMMGDDWVLVGYETSEQLAVKQREYFVKHFKRAKYVLNDAPKKAQQATQTKHVDGIIVAPRPQVILPKALADASLLADIIASKFVDALSFYRKMKILEREQIHIGYSTVCDWPIQLHQRLSPLKHLLYKQLTRYDVWHLDETRLQVLNEVDRKNTLMSYLWGIRAGPPGEQVILFHYDRRKSYQALAAWLSPYLAGFTGAIVTDEHKPYNNLVKDYPQIKAHGGCWAHLRRKFSDAAKGRKSSSDAHKMLVLIAALYRLDAKVKHLTGEEKKTARQKQLRPQVEKIKRYVNQLSSVYVHDGLMHTAIQYATNNWCKFTACLEHPELPLDNNPIEQAIRPFTLGRKNWLFSGSPRGAEASAFMYSLVETAKANGWEPKAYLKTLFERYPLAKNDEQRRDLLPMFLKPSKLSG